MMKVLLVYPPSKSIYGLPRYPTLGLTYLATVLDSLNYQVRVLDMRLPKNDLPALKRKLSSFKPQIVGVGSTSFDFPGAKQVFKLVKLCLPRTVTVLGGPHASICTEKIMANKAIDYLIIGEGEESLPKLLSAIQKKTNLKKVKGLIYRKPTQKIALSAAPELIQNMDKLPFPKWELHSLTDYQVRGKLTLPLFSSRGCPFGCVYCVSWKIHGKKFRFRSPKNVVDEIENDIQKYHAFKFSFLDDIFSLDKKRAKAICREIIKRKLQISWTCDQGIRADGVDKELLGLMKKSGCRLIALGVESADQGVLDLMKKGEKLEVIRKAIKEAKKVGLTVKTFFIIGGPGDNLEKTKESIRFFKETGVDIPRFGMMTAYPGSQMWQWVEKNGRFLGNPYRYIEETPTTAGGVQFETKDFRKKARLEAFALADKEAEIWAIRQRLSKMVGRFCSSVLVLPFYFKEVRKLVNKVYRLRLFSASD